MPLLCETISILGNANTVAAQAPARSRCISISSSNVRGSEAVSSSSSGDFIHSWYVFGQVSEPPKILMAPFNAELQAGPQRLLDKDTRANMLGAHLRFRMWEVSSYTPRSPGHAQVCQHHRQYFPKLSSRQCKQTADDGPVRYENDPVAAQNGVFVDSHDLRGNGEGGW